jgi:hypothetical protein
MDIQAPSSHCLACHPDSFYLYANAPLACFQAYTTANSLLTVLGIAVIVFNGRAECPAGTVLKQAMAVTSTLWPILFAAIIGPMIRAAALYQAERGTKLGVSCILYHAVCDF